MCLSAIRDYANAISSDFWTVLALHRFAESTVGKKILAHISTIFAPYGNHCVDLISQVYLNHGTLFIQTYDSLLR